jgi:predicted methyltransferase
MRPENRNEVIVVSYVQIRPILEARDRGLATATTSIDLGRTNTPIRLEADRVVLSDDCWLPWDTIGAIANSPSSCFAVEGGSATKIQAYSPDLDRLYSLFPTEGAPTVLISGIPMHRIKDVDPLEDTHRKVRSIAPIGGRVLDTATGLGYTAIEAARTAEKVVTIELDPVIQEVARLNPYSRTLFEDPKIEQRFGDSFDVVATLESSSFSRVIHDPPTFALAGQLYSAEFYRQLHRVLKRHGQLYHYIGDITSGSAKRVAQGVTRRLQQAGFTRVVQRPETFGIVAFK